MKIKPISRQILFLLGFSLFSIQVFGQVEDLKKFESIPSPMRERLVERLNQFIEYDLSSQHEKRYELFTENIIRFIGNKTNYVNQVRQWELSGTKEDLIAFNISSVKSRHGDNFDYRFLRITGVAKLRLGKMIKEKERFLWANYQKGDWYFSNWMQWSHKLHSNNKDIP